MWKRIYPWVSLFILSSDNCQALASIAHYATRFENSGGFRYESSLSSTNSLRMLCINGITEAVEKQLLNHNYLKNEHERFELASSITYMVNRSCFGWKTLHNIAKPNFLFFFETIKSIKIPRTDVTFKLPPFMDSLSYR